MPPGQRQLAERRLLTALRRLHRREPMAPDIHKLAWRRIILVV